MSDPSTSSGLRWRTLSLLLLCLTLVCAGLWVRQLRLALADQAILAEAQQERLHLEVALSELQRRHATSQQDAAQVRAWLELYSDNVRWYLNGSAGRALMLQDSHRLGLILMEPPKVPRTGTAATSSPETGLQLWCLDEQQQPRSLGMLPVGAGAESGPSGLLLPLPEGMVAGFIVTQEALTGSTQPTGPIVLQALMPTLLKWPYK